MRPTLPTLLWCTIVVSLVACGCFLSRNSSAQEFQPQNLALGKSYTWSFAPNYMHGGSKMCTDEDDVIQLTDGKYSKGFWWDPLLCGWGSFAYLDIIIDLEQVEPIYRVIVHAASRPDAWMFPKTINIYVSDDQESWYDVGQWPGTRQELQTDRNNYQELVTEGLHTKGRYVAVKFQGNAFIDEIKVVSGPHRVDSVDFAGREPMSTLDLSNPFFDTPPETVYVSRERFYPIVLARRKTFEDMRVTVPAGVEVRIRPEALGGATTEEGTTTYSLGKFEGDPTILYTRTDLPVGPAGELHLSGIIEGQRREVTLPLDVVEVPVAPRPQQWVTTATFVLSEFFRHWPGFVESWSSAGMSTVAVHSQDSYRIPGRPDIRQFITEMKEEGFFVGGNLSPFNPWPGALDIWPDVHRWVNPSGKELEFPCPFGYMETMRPREIAAVQQGTGAGIGMYFLDSEPSIPSGGKGGEACFCERCTEHFRQYLAQNYPDLEYVDPKEIVTAEEPDPRLLRAWRESTQQISIEIFKPFRDLVDAVTPTGPVRLGNYQTDGRNEENRNFHNLEVLVEASVFDHTTPSLYGQTPDVLGDNIAEVVQNTNVPTIAWISTGLGPKGEHYPVEMLRPLFYEALVNGALGYLIFTPGMMNAQDYREHALAIRALAPVESLLLDSNPINRHAVTGDDNSVRVAGSWDEGRYVLLISRGRWVERHTYAHKYEGEIIPVWEADYAGELPEATYEIHCPMIMDCAVIDLEEREVVGQGLKATDSFTVTLSPEHPYRLLLIVPHDEADKYVGEG